MQNVSLARSFLRVLSTLVSHSVVVRTTISGHTHFRAIGPSSPESHTEYHWSSKVLYLTLCPFCDPGAGVQGVEICKAMERPGVINICLAASGGFGMTLVATKGVEVELEPEEVESAHRVYPP